MENPKCRRSAGRTPSEATARLDAGGSLSLLLRDQHFLCRVQKSTKAQQMLGKWLLLPSLGKKPNPHGCLKKKNARFEPSGARSFQIMRWQRCLGSPPKTWIVPMIHCVKDQVIFAGSCQKRHYYRSPLCARNGGYEGLLRGNVVTLSRASMLLLPNIRFDG